MGFSLATGDQQVKPTRHISRPDPDIEANSLLRKSALARSALLQRATHTSFLPSRDARHVRNLVDPSVIAGNLPMDQIFGGPPPDSNSEQITTHQRCRSDLEILSRQGGRMYPSKMTPAPPTHLQVHSDRQSAPEDALLSVPVRTVAVCRRWASAGARPRSRVACPSTPARGCGSLVAMAGQGTVDSATRAFR